MLFIRLAFIFISLPVFATKLPELMTKQSLDNIKFISLDGKYTYYQRESGSLNLSTNFSSSEVLSFENGTEYILSSTPARKRIAVEVIKDFHKIFSFFKNNELYYISFGDAKAQKIADGVSLKLHLDDNWASFYRPRERNVVFKNISANKEYRVQINKTKNSYFIPEMALVNNDYALYTDINEEGYAALVAISLNDNSTQAVYKSTQNATKLEFCLNETDIFLGEFSLTDAKRGSTIFKIPLYNNKDYKKQEIIYSTQVADLGNLVCDEKNIYFIKTIQTNNELNSQITEAASLNLETREIEIKSELRRVQSIINMDGRLLIPLTPKVYVLKGESDQKTEEIKGGSR